MSCMKQIAIYIYLSEKIYLLKLDKFRSCTFSHFMFFNCAAFGIGEVKRLVRIASECSHTTLAHARYDTIALAPPPPPFSSRLHT